MSDLGRFFLVINGHKINRTPCTYLFTKHSPQRMLGNNIFSPPAKTKNKLSNMSTLRELLLSNIGAHHLQHQSAPGFRFSGKIWCPPFAISVCAWL